MSENTFSQWLSHLDFEFWSTGQHKIDPPIFFGSLGIGVEASRFGMNPGKSQRAKNGSEGHTKTVLTSFWVLAVGVNLANGEDDIKLAAWKVGFIVPRAFDPNFTAMRLNNALGNCQS